METERSLDEEPRPDRRGLLTIQAALDAHSRIVASLMHGNREVRGYTDARENDPVPRRPCPNLASHKFSIPPDQEQDRPQLGDRGGTWACRSSFIDGHHRTRRAPDGAQLTPPPSQVGNSREIRQVQENMTP